MKQFLVQNTMSRANCANMLELIREFGQLTRRQLEAATGLSWGGVTNMVNRLIGAGYVVESKNASGTTSGRVPGLLEINGDDHFTLGIDVNDTGLSACVLNLRDEKKAEFALEADFSSPEALRERICALIQMALDKFADKNVLAIGVSMQGMVDGRNGISVRLPQCPGWQNVPLKALIESRFSKETVIAHDPDCMLLSHISKTDDENVVLIRLDKSVGMAAALHGEILSGCGLWEAAHMVVDPKGPACRCGERGCLDAYVAACAADKENRFDALSALPVPLATAAGNIVRLLRPETLILCGDLMRDQAYFHDAFLKQMHTSGVSIHTIADARAAMEGAALMAAKHAISRLEI